MIFDYPRYYLTLQAICYQTVCNHEVSTFVISNREERSKLHDYVNDIRGRTTDLENLQCQRIYLVGDSVSITNCIYNDFNVTDLFRLGLTVVDSESLAVGCSIPVDVFSVDLRELSFSTNSIHTFPLLHCFNLRELHFGAHCCDSSPSFFLSCLETPNLRKLVFESASFCETKMCVIRNLPFLSTIIVNESAFSPILFNDFIHLTEREKASFIGCHTGLFLLDNLPRLKRLFITSGCFLSYHEFIIRNLPQLTSFITDNSCFVGVRSVCFDLPSLTSIRLGSGSFRYTNELTIKAPSLSTFIVERYCFHDVRSVCWNDLPCLQTIEIGYKAFEKTKHVEVINCPSLLYIKIDKCCFVDAESLALHNLEELKTFEVLNYSFSNTSRLSMKQLPKLNYLHFDGTPKAACFYKTEDLELVNVASPYDLEIHPLCFMKKGERFFLGSMS